MSIYREEAMDTLISCLRNSESPTTQICAAETILSLQGSFSYSGKSLSRAILLKRAGLNRSYVAFMRRDQRRHNISANAQDTKVLFLLHSHFPCTYPLIKASYRELTWFLNDLGRRESS